ncbi:MAG: type Z 30S ribosomal protein S14 [Fervidobacterium sp.]|uniref:Small ribosomal subunit protein uS14 n=1 Tax=Fervidobacterium gondwanense DSM 13020 TaxID=1121883 RepID=A0A1M7T861_FERGO|nr:type Z 30S ribosomal protein S14 [Fervidobacterium gondwanense]UXF01362.1 30S ribosomal protein S14 type Z [Fervidobacterium riparium]SHN66852.1 SSU ribosomal protein S14P [Fervidobacterium gondwanense DSM 13020]
MARKAMVEKWKRPKKYKVREYTRCSICGRVHSVYQEFGICRVCFRKLANEGKLPGVRKASW